MKCADKDLLLYAVTDRYWLGERTLHDVVKESLDGGVTFVQLREKHLDQAHFLEEAKDLKMLCKSYNVPFVINDNVDIALEMDADGVHVGQSDMPYEMVKRLLPEGKMIGLSVESPEQVLEANDFDLDYVAASPVFSTTTKTNTIVEWGLDGLRWIKSVSKHPLVAIGGIHPDNVASVFQAGADSVAVISAIVSAKDPEAAARELLKKSTCF